MMKMTHAYLSGPIIHNELRKDDFYKVIVNTLESQGITVFAPQFLPPTSAEEIYRRDVERVRMCDFLVAEVSNPSLGVGMELMLAIELQKPVLLFRQKSANQLSRMVQGAKGIALFEYEKTDDVGKILNSIELESLIIQKCAQCGSHISNIVGTNSQCIICNNAAYKRMTDR